MAQHFSALADVNRLRILQCLSHGARTVSELCSELELSQPNVSAHLSVLRGAGFVVGTRRGKNMVYTLTDTTATSLCELVCGSIRQRQKRLRTLFEETALSQSRMNTISENPKGGR